MAGLKVNGQLGWAMVKLEDIKERGVTAEMNLIVVWNQDAYIHTIDQVYHKI